MAREAQLELTEKRTGSEEWKEGCWTISALRIKKVNNLRS